jgi:K+-sensing histidine kinase KdpD
LKTPLASMAAIADALRRSDYGTQAVQLTESIETMQRHVERQLALARSHGGSSAVSSFTHRVGDAIQRMIDVLRKLPSERSLEWSVTGDVGVSAPIEAEDFDEIVGNLLDNARKWAQSSVLVQIVSAPEGVHVTVSDDGPGIAAEHVRLVLERNARLDERVQGSGLGLSIVQTVLETYRSELHLDRSETGGLLATFLIPNESIGRLA